MFICSRHPAPAASGRRREARLRRTPPFSVSAAAGAAGNALVSAVVVGYLISMLTLWLLNIISR